MTPLSPINFSGTFHKNFQNILTYHDESCLQATEALSNNFWRKVAKIKQNKVLEEYTPMVNEES